MQHQSKTKRCEMKKHKGYINIQRRSPFLVAIGGCNNLLNVRPLHACSHFSQTPTCHESILTNAGVI